MLVSELRARLRAQQDRLGDVEVLVDVRPDARIVGVADVDYDQFEPNGPHFAIVTTDATDR
jgi:hypothetical protein